MPCVSGKEMATCTHPLGINCQAGATRATPSSQRRRSSVVERTTHNRVVGGSIPPGATKPGFQFKSLPFHERLSCVVVLSHGQ
jgi:hypothetical protein